MNAQRRHGRSRRRVRLGQLVWDKMIQWRELSGCPEKTWKKQMEGETRAVCLEHNDTMERVKWMPREDMEDSDGG